MVKGTILTSCFHPVSPVCVCFTAVYIIIWYTNNSKRFFFKEVFEIYETETPITHTKPMHSIHASPKDIWYSTSPKSNLHENLKDSDIWFVRNIEVLKPQLFDKLNVTDLNCELFHNICVKLCVF